MTKTLGIYSVMLVASMALIGMPGCSKKSVQSGGDSQSTQGMAKKGSSGNGGGSGSSGTTDSSRSGVGSFPDTGVQSAGGGLRGLDKNPSEERVGNGTMLAKMDPSGSDGRQLDEIRAEQAASSAAGLRDVLFGYDSWTISEEGRQALTRDAEWMKSNPGAQVKVEGHCDERGTADYNLVLGEKRAKAVRNYLVELGIGANRLSVVSYGKERPFCQEHAESCYQQNRRGHLALKTGK
ncbi:MAG: peptidoglycan-associated lipoprotein Pal [Nitrospirae bacterium]|nr:peptidoglycan-associated lipoprotein Pal [Nitrospirota bacterium]MDE3050181.1 peptidoglycan-associated lipoprotein Pal [Nitrospirota bacterium]